MKQKYLNLVELPVATESKSRIVLWLESITDKAIALNPNDVFKRYRPLDRGNRKLAKNILSFSLPSITTCGQYCEGCYDLRAMRYKSARMKRYVNYSMTLHKMEELEELIVKQIKASRSVEYIRLHVGGEFYSLEYVQAWGRIVKRVKAIKPDVKFYTYTKSLYTGILQGYGINVVKSVYPDGSFNYAPVDEVIKSAKKHKGKVCPATLRKVPDGFCGSKCTLCMACENVFFVKH